MSAKSAMSPNKSLAPPPRIRVHLVTDEDEISDIITMQIRHWVEDGGYDFSIDRRNYIGSEIRSLESDDFPDLLILDGLAKQVAGEGLLDLSMSAAKFLELLRNKYSAIPTVIVARGGIEKFIFEVFQRWCVTIWQPASKNGREGLQKNREQFRVAVQTALEAEANRKRRVALDVRRTLCYLQIQDGDCQFYLDRPYYVSFEPANLIRDVQALRLRVGKTINDSWQQQVYSAGRRLYKLLLEDVFGTKFLSALKEIKSVTEFRFAVNLNNKDFHDLFLLPFEVVTSEDEGTTDQFFCTAAPMARQSSRANDARVRPDMLRMLFIAGARGGVASIQHDRTGRQSAIELDQLKFIGDVQTHLGQFAPGPIQVAGKRHPGSSDKPAVALRSSRKPRSGTPKPVPLRQIELTVLDDTVATGEEFLELLKAELEDNCYDIIHYHGHSVDKPDDGGTFLILPNDEDASGRSTSVRQVAGWIKKLDRKVYPPHLIFLSSCQSASIRTAIEMADAEVENIVGFRWEVEEEAAAQYVKSFYTSYLQAGKSITESFRQACAESQNMRRGDPVWASAIAIVNDWDVHFGEVQ